MIDASPLVSAISNLAQDFESQVPTPRVALGKATDDQACQQRIETLLRDQQHPELQHIQISSDRGTVTLQGRVSSFYLRQLCIRCCQQTVGVFKINDRLEVVA